MARLVQFGTTPHYLVGASGYYAAVPPALDLSLVSTDLSEGALLTFRVTASKVWDEDVTVAYATSNGTASAGTDYTAASGTATIPAGSVTTDLSVQTTDRSGVQADRTFTLTISAPTTTSGDVPALGVAAVEVTIDDTDVDVPIPGLVVTAVSAAEEGSTLTFRVSTQDFAPAPTALPFSYATADGTAAAGTDYTATSGDVAILTGQSSLDITVQTTARSGYQASRTVILTITHPSTVIATPTATGIITDTEAPMGDHGYYESLVGGAYFWKSLSLRSQVDINTYSQTSPNDEVTYAPGADAYTDPQDAAKLTMRAWSPNPSATVYGTAMGTNDLSLTLGLLDGSAPNGNTAFNAKGAYIRIEDEIMLTVDNASVFDRLTGVMNLAARGQAGTTAVPHPVGATVYRSSNSLRNQVKFPLNTENGHIYFFTWDAYFDESHYDAGVGQWKLFQLRSDQSIWLEPRITFGPTAAIAATPGYNASVHIANVDVRTYNASGGNADYTLNAGNKLGYLGPNASKLGTALAPQLNSFLIRKSCWTRWFMKLDQQADDYDLVSMWIADEVTEPVQLFDELQISVRGKWNSGTQAMDPPERINDWDIEFNTSTNSIEPERAVDFRDLISYMRNFVALVDVPSDVSGFLIKPTVSS